MCYEDFADVIVYCAKFEDEIQHQRATTRDVYSHINTNVTLATSRPFYDVTPQSLANMGLIPVAFSLILLPYTAIITKVYVTYSKQSVFLPFSYGSLCAIRFRMCCLSGVGV